MDKKAKKRVAVLQAKRANLRTQLSTVRRFTDDPDEIPRIEAEIAKIEAELKKLQG